MRTVALFILSTALFSFSCENQSSLSDIGPERQSEVSAVVVYEGDPAVDGCGWLIQHAQKFYSPVNLGSDFKIDSLKIVLSYKVLESTWNCGWREPGYKQIEVLKMKKQ
jgi:hypothetical protein